jgi:hypothetical protein
LDESGLFDAEELQTGLFSSGTFRVSGWALDPAGATAGGVEVVVDGKPFVTNYGLSRPDVAAYFQSPSYEKSGFSFSMPAGQLMRGMHRFSIRIIDRAGRAYFESAATPIAPIQQVTVTSPPVTTEIAPGAIEGFLDSVDNNQIAGWAWDKAHPDSIVQVEVYDGNTRLAIVRADLFRQDLLDAHKGAGTHGFIFTNPITSRGAAKHEVRALVAGKELGGSPKVFIMPGQ